MDRRERIHDPAETLRVAMQAALARVWTALPGIIQSFNPEQMTATIQPAINGQMLDPTTGLYTSLQMPILSDCPILWQGGGGAILTFPIAAGDECLVVFSARCIDGWWSNGSANGPTDPPETRLHNLSDGFALVGVRSLPNAFTVSTSFAALRSVDGTTFVELNPSGQTVTVTAPQGITLNGVTIDTNGNLNSPATITGATDVKTGTISLKNHIHSGGNLTGGLTGAAQG